MMMRLLVMLLCCYGMLCQAESRAETQPHMISAVQSLVTDGAAAMAQQQVFLLYVSRPQCPYCAALEKEVLLPMLKDPALRSKLYLRELSWDAVGVVDFQGRQRTARDLIADLGIPGAPTLLFLDGSGAELAQPIVGYHSRDFYWAYFERAIAQAYASIAATAPES